MPDINIIPINEVYIKIICEDSISRELYEYFSFFAENYQFHPKFKKRIWDGKIHLFDRRYSCIYRGLLAKVLEFAETYKYSVVVDDSLTTTENFSTYDAGKFVSTLNLPDSCSPHDYQIEAFVSSIHNKRELFLSPTGSGKSLIIYLICRYLKTLNYKKGLVIVPTTALVEQLYQNFEEDFEWDETEKCVHRIYSGKEKYTDHFLTISTWQSVSRFEKDYLEKFDFVIGDEAHTFQAKSLVNIMTNLSNAKVRISCTGSLDGSKVNELTLMGLFGNIKRYVDTKELIERKILSDLMIKCLILKHTENNCEAAWRSNKYKGFTYDEELDFIVSLKQRSTFIKNLALSLKGNTIILFKYVEKHGKIIYDMICKENKDKEVFFIDKDTPVKEREEIRKRMEFIDNAILMASYGLLSTGVNIKNLHNYISASPSKSKIRVIQSIGRILRIAYGKKEAVLYDIVDDLRHKKYENHLIGHFRERLNIYKNQQFKFKFYNIQLKEKL